MEKDSLQNFEKMAQEKNWMRYQLNEKYIDKL